MMRILILLLISFSSYGQALNLLGFNRQREADTPVGGTELYIDNVPEGTSNGQNNYVGASWGKTGSKAGAYDNTFALTNAGTDNGNTADDPYVQVYFTGHKLEIIAERYPSHGIMAVSIDGGAETMVDQYATNPLESMIAGIPQVLHTISGLTDAPHVLKVRNTGDANTLATGTYLVWDAVRVTTAGSAPPPTPSSGDLFVAKTGSSDGNDCTAGTPCLTIQRAASLAQAGDIISIGAGTYRETIAPTNSGTSGNPIIFQAAAGATVIVSGLDAIADNTWVAYDVVPGGDQIYRTPVSNGPMYTEKMTGHNTNNLQYNNTQLLAQQLFKGGAMQFQAMFPKPTSVENILERSSSRSTVHVGTFGSTQITDAGFAPFGSNGLDEGEVWVQGWFITRTRHITSQSGNTITYQDTGDNGDHAFSKFFKVFNKLELLTQAKEWHYDGTYFYFWQTGGGSPTGVEYKKRNWGFDLRNKSFITVEGINFIGCDPVMTNPSSLNITIDNIRATYTSHHMLESDGGNSGYCVSPVQTGTKLLGAGSIIKNSEFNYASGTTLWLGSNTEARNNKFQNGNYIGFYNAFIKLAYSGTTGSTNVKILNNTFQRAGRSHIQTDGESFDITHNNIEIGYNDFSGHIMINVDAGAIYAARHTVFVNSRYHHNWFHDPLFDEAGTGAQRGIHVNGNYFDMASGPITFDHNIHWNGIPNSGRPAPYSADYYTQTVASDVGEIANGKALLYNNTFASTPAGTPYSYVVYNNNASVKDIHRNGIYRGIINQDWGLNGAAPDLANSLSSGTNPLFTGGSLSTPATYFSLQSGSPARGIGTALSGINDGDTNPKESGAIYFGQTPATVGYVSVTYTPTP